MPRMLLRWLRVLGPLIAMLLLLVLLLLLLGLMAGAAGSAVRDAANSTPHSIFQELLKIT